LEVQTGFKYKLAGTRHLHCLISDFAWMITHSAATLGTNITSLKSVGCVAVTQTMRALGATISSGACGGRYQAFGGAI
jgi:hypothetical protein